MINIHLIDVVSGGVVATIAHRRARGPINIVHSENWLVYTYFNDKVRRTEISKIDRYISQYAFTYLLYAKCEVCVLCNNRSKNVFPFFFFIAAIELYEGNTQANSTVWSSLDAPPLPVIEQQSYILPANVLTLKETITEKGITNKHILSM